MGESSTPKESAASAGPVAPTVAPANPTHPTPQYTASYLAELLKDKKQLAAFPNVFTHIDRLIDEEVSKVRVSLFQFEFNKHGLELPDNDGSAVQTMQEKVYVPVQDYPDYNFVGRILGPRGMTAKQLEQETGCKIMVRGKGSMRDKKKEEANRGKPNWEHLSDELHVLIQCEDTEARSKVKLQRAVQEINKLLVPAPEGEDELKRKQLMELAIINGTYRPSNAGGAGAAGRLLTPMTLASPMRSPTLGAPIILSPNGGRAPGAPGSNAASLAVSQPSISAAAAAQLQGFLPHQLQALLPQSVADLQAQSFMLNGQLGAGGLGAGTMSSGQDQLAAMQAAMQQAAMYPYQLQTALASPLLADYPAIDPTERY